MTNKELLELAAKANGIAGIVLVNDSGVYWNEFPNLPGAVYNDHWNPLENDAQAFQLMAKLRIELYYSEGFVFVKGAPGLMPDSLPCEALDMHENDINSATRRAITRAAAEVAMTSNEKEVS